MAKKKQSVPEYGTVTRKGTLYYRTRITDADGKQVSLYATTCEELYEKQLEARRQVEEIIFHRKHPTVAEYCEKWLLMQSAKVSTATIKGYRQNMKNYVINSLGDMYMEEVTADDIRLALVPLSQKSKGLYDTVNMLIKCVFYSAERSQLITDNPCVGISAKGGKASKKKDALTDQQVAILRDTVKELPPYLFIMIIIQDLLINLDFANLFKRTSTYIFFMSIISGSPSNAYIISKLVKEEKITKEYGNTCLIFTFFTNPLFLYSILNIIFNSLYMTIKIMIIIYISNFIIYLYYKKDLPVANMYGKSSNFNLPSSIKSSINTNLMVLGSIVFYFIISNILINTFNIGYPFNIFLRGLLEMTQGLNNVIYLNSDIKVITTVIFITFGGFSIHTQVKCILDEYGLDYKYFFKGRILQLIIAIILTFIP